MMNIHIVSGCAILLNFYLKETIGHGFLMDPPGRSSMWKYGFDTEINYQHMELFCGGFPVQWVNNGGKCGICGDPFNGVRENEPPGKYAKGIITKTYKQGDVITVTVQITASHRGYFEFRLCPHNDVTTPVTQECLNRYLLTEPTSFGSKFYVDDTSVGVYNIRLKLPDRIVCDQCVLQWRYRTGNRWGCYNDDLNGPCGMGIGPQEEFYACSDVRITSDGTTSVINTTTAAPPTTTLPVTQPPTTPPRTTQTTPPTTTGPAPPTDITCVAVGPWKKLFAMDYWCNYNCKRRYCPTSHCKCQRENTLQTSSDRWSDCVSVYNVPMWDVWCQHNCPLGLCYQNMCVCPTVSERDDREH